MSLPHAILGLLSYRAMTGYDLKRDWFDQSMQYFWPADQAQIYRTLDKLVSDGLVRFEVVPGQDRPNRKVYSLTTAGGAELDRWLMTPATLPVVRDPLLVQLFCAERVPTPELIDLARHSQEQHAARLAAYERIAAQLPTLGSGKRLQLWRMVVGNGLHRERAYLAWLAETIAALTAMAGEADAKPEATNGE